MVSMSLSFVMAYPNRLGLTSLSMEEADESGSTFRSESPGPDLDDQCEYEWKRDDIVSRVS